MSGFLDKTGLAHLWEKMKSALSDKQDKLTAGDNITIIDNRISAKTKFFYGTCTTASATAEKVVECSDWQLEDGNAIVVRFANANTSSSTMYLNVNGTGAIPVGPITNPIYFWRNGSDVVFVYDSASNKYVMANANLATTGYYGFTKLSTSISSTSQQMASTPSATKKAYDLANNAYSMAATAEETAEGKQDKLTAGTGITIQDNVISADGNSPTFYTVVGSSSSGFSFEDYLRVEKHDFSKGTITSAGSGYFELTLTNMKFTGVEGGTYYTAIEFETTLFGTACTINIPARVALSVVNSDVASVDIELLAGLWTFETAQSGICYQALKSYDASWGGQEFSCTEV